MQKCSFKECPFTWVVSLIVFLLITIILGVVGIVVHVACNKVANVMLSF